MSWFAAVAPAVIVFDFDPVAVIAGFAVRWQMAAVAAVIFEALVLAGVIALVAERRRVARLAADPERATAVAEAVRAAEETVRSATDSPGEPPDAGDDASDGDAPAPVPPPAVEERAWPVGLRPDDLLFIVAGGVAGAVVVGRLGWVLLYVDWYRAHADAILDPAVGGLTLAGGLVGGIIAGLAMAVLLGAPVARWLGVAVVPLLLALGLGKLAMVLGGAGQGLPTDASWATAYAGPGPWGSLGPIIPSHPAQAYEALTTLAALLVVLLFALVPACRRHPAALFAVGIGLWAVGRFAVAFTWRDPALLGSLNGDQLVTLGMTVVAVVALVGVAVRAKGAAPVSRLAVAGVGAASAAAEAADAPSETTPPDPLAPSGTNDEGPSPEA